MNNQPNQDEELKKVIEESSLCHLCLSNVSEGEKEIEELISSIKQWAKDKYYEPNWHKEDKC